MRIKAVLFDMDGVLVDGKEWHYEALNTALRKTSLGVIKKENHIKIFDGLPTKKKLDIYSETTPLTKYQKEKVYALKQEETRNLIKKYCKKNNIHVELMNFLKKENIRTACWSNAIRTTMEEMLSRSELLSYMEFLISNEDVEKPKPSPEIYLKAINKMGIKADEVLICEDNINGIKAAIDSKSWVLPIRKISDVNTYNIKKAIKKIENNETDTKLINNN
ncbi:MAG: HAD family phosphatase [Legionellales bacterium]|jgi:beta-phosphoglucomutase|nr:HAD family phosphatase [Legionellales bacterium]